MSSVNAAKHLAFLTEDILIIHHTDRGDVLFWSGNGWTAELENAMRFAEIDKAMVERRAAKRAHPLMRITLHIEEDAS